MSFPTLHTTVKRPSVAPATRIPSVSIELDSDGDELFQAKVRNYTLICDIVTNYMLVKEIDSETEYALLHAGFDLHDPLRVSPSCMSHNFGKPRTIYSGNHFESVKRALIWT